MKITKYQLLNMIEESVKRNLTEAPEKVEAENDYDMEALVAAFNTAIKDENSQYNLQDAATPCRLDITLMNREKIMYVLGADSFTVLVPDNQQIRVEKVPMDAYHRGYMIRMVIDSGIFTAEEIGDTLTTRG